MMSIVLGMPVLEDGLSDSECVSDDEQSLSMKSKLNGRHQSTQSDFLFDSNHSSLITSSHKRQFAKSTTINGTESQSKSFYIRPPPPSSFVRPVMTSRTNSTSISTNEVHRNQTKTSGDDPSTLPTGTINARLFVCFSSSTYNRFHKIVVKLRQI
jgi:hypothetical protein